MDRQYEENARIYELFETQVGVAVLSGMTEDQMAACVLSPSDGLPISTRRFLDIFGDYLEHAKATMLNVRKAAVLPPLPKKPKWDAQ